jgi:D-tyrosyl-tRNA(Tyr) deacylase
VTVDGEQIASINTGLLVLVGVTHCDDEAAAQALARKVHGLRILRDERSVADEPEAAVLVVSQFTLYGETARGHRPSFSRAADPELAEPLYERVCRRLLDEGVGAVERGRFGAYMQVELVNDGPVTIVVELARKPEPPLPGP